VTPNPALRRFFLVVAVLLLLGLTWTGLQGGASLLRASQSGGQKLQAFLQIAFGLFALLSAVSIFSGRRWFSLAPACFAMTLSLAAGLFVVVWSHSPVIVGIVTGLLALCVSLAIIWLLGAGARGLTRA
jgi:hypothetical protein